jgi:hypothetical protein
MILLAKGMEHRQEVDFENWLMSFDISLSFQNIKKSLYEAVEIIISKFLSPHLGRWSFMYLQF